MTGGRFLKILTIISFAVFIIFAVTVVVREVLRPDDKLGLIMEKKCSSVYTVPGIKDMENLLTLSEIPKNESELELDENHCLFVPAGNQRDTKFTESLFIRDSLFSHRYLYMGNRGVLIQKHTVPYAKYADKIYACIRLGRCEINEDEGQKFTLTIAFSRKNNYPVTVTFSEKTMSRIFSEAPGLLSEMMKIKELSPENYALEIVFHKGYSFFEKKESDFIEKMIKRGVDGLFLASRGAEIRLLPFETSSGYLKKLSSKGRQYGLDKNEYEKDVASLSFIRTERYREKNLAMRPFTGFSFRNKSQYSAIIMRRMLTRYLLENQNSEGFFHNTVDVSDGKILNKKGKLFNQIRTLEALSAIMRLHSDDTFSSGHGYDLREAINRSLKFLSSEISSAHIVTKLYFYRVLIVSKNVFPVFSDEVNEFIDDITEFINQAIEKEELFPLKKEYTGIFYRALEVHPDFYGTPEIGIFIKNAASEFVSREPGDIEKRRKYYVYLLPFIVRHNIESALGSAVKTFAFFRERRHFPDISGAVLPEDGAFYPDSTVTARVAASVAESYYLNSTVTEKWFSPGSFASFLKFSTLTSDDTFIWENPSIKKKVLGGVRKSPFSKKIYLAATAPALIYFSYAESKR